MTDRVIEAVSYIVCRIAAEEDIEGLDVEIIDRLIGSGFSPKEITDAFRFLSSVTGEEATAAPPKRLSLFESNTVH